MGQDWDIKTRGHKCTKCGVVFGDGQMCFSMLVFGEKGYARGDYCAECWPLEKQASSPHSSWQGAFRLPPPPPEEPLKKETAESLLRRLVEKGDESSRNVIYILAVMLERKKVLAERDVQLREDGVMVRVYEHRGTGESFVICDPRLTLGDLEQVQQQVVEMLGAGAGEQAAQPTGEGTNGISTG